MTQSLSERLEELVEKARNHVMTPEERFEQRVSFVYGQMNGSMTKDEVRQSLINLNGYPARPVGE